MNRTQRLLSLVLALALSVSLVSLPTAQAAGTSTYNGTSYSTDYTTWRQADAAWGSTALGDVHTMTSSGCLISSIAILLCYSGAYDPASMNPGVFRDWLDTKGYISHSSDRSKDALLSFGLITSTSSPRFYFVNQVFFSVSTSLTDVCSKIDQAVASGYYVVARVKNSGHFVAVARTVDGDAQIYDPGASSKKLLSEYDGTIGGLLYFKANTNGKDGILSDSAAPTTPTVNTLSGPYGDGDNVTISWSSATRATHYNLYIDQKQSDGSWKENYRYYFYASSPYSVPALPAGTYRVKVQATNANTSPWTYSNADYQTFTVQANSLTVTYNANGGTVSPSSVLVTKGSTYSLPTPTKSGSAFLGWYTSDGSAVNNSTKITTATGHTLIAKWASGGNTLTKTTSYQNVFTDVATSAWYYDSVASVYSYGLMNGVETKLFQPTDQVTTAQAITLAARLRKLYLTGSGTFTTSSPWYKTYVDYAVSQKIISSSPTTAEMDETLTRQEFASIIAGAIPDAGLPAINTVAAGSISDVYRSDTAIYKLYRAGIFAGNDEKGTFLPNAAITRAEVAAVIVRLADPNSRVLFTLK